MPFRLRPEEIVTIRVLNEKGTPKRAIARQLGVSEGLVRYHLKRQAEGKEDGRRRRELSAAKLRPTIAAYFAAVSSSNEQRPVNVRVLHEHLVRRLDYPDGEAAYRRILRFVRAEFPKPKIRTFRRVETPPGAQCQTDWGEFSRIDVGDGPEPLHALVMSLSHSRKTAVIWNRHERMLNWLSSHNAAFRRLGGVPAVNRIDNLKTGIIKGSGASGTINPTYLTYAKMMRFHVDACPPRQGWAKGKVEAKVRLARLIKDLIGARHQSLDTLQRETDAALADWEERAICPVTGTSVKDAWCAERPLLGALPEFLPEPFDIAVERRVQKDCTIHFEGRRYGVPFSLVGERVQVRGCAETLQVIHDDVIVAEWPRGTQERLLIDPSHYEGSSTDRVMAPAPLGKMGRRMQEILETEVEMRPIDLYAALAEVAR